MDEFEKQIQTLESVLPLIFKYRQAIVKKTRLRLVFSTCLSAFRNQRKKLKEYTVFKVAPYCFLKLLKMQVSTSKSVHGYVHIYRKRMKLTLCVE